MTQLAQTAEPVLRPISDVKRFTTARVVMALVLREMSTSYGRSPGGYIWAILEPIGGITMMVIVFSILLRSPPLGTSFPIFYATGLVPFSFWASTSGRIASALTYSRSLISYPRVTFVDAIIARFIVNFITQMLVAYFLFTGILMLFDSETIPNFPAIALCYAMASALGVGVGVMNCFLGAMYPLWNRFWAIATRPLFLVSCIFMLYETVPEPYQSILWYNPLVHVCGQMRKAFFPFYDAVYVSPAYVFGVSLVLMVTGLIFLQRYHREMRER